MVVSPDFWLPSINSTQYPFTSWGMMGMPTDQIAKVFQMDASEVVKILERAERSSSKDGSWRGKRVDEMISWETSDRLQHDSGEILTWLWQW